MRSAKEGYTRHCKLLINGCKGNKNVPRESRASRVLGVLLSTQIFLIEVTREEF